MNENLLFAAFLNGKSPSVTKRPLCAAMQNAFANYPKPIPVLSLFFSFRFYTLGPPKKREANQTHLRLHWSGCTAVIEHLRLMSRSLKWRQLHEEKTLICDTKKGKRKKRQKKEKNPSEANPARRERQRTRIRRTNEIRRAFFGPEGEERRFGLSFLYLFWCYFSDVEQIGGRGQFWTVLQLETPQEPHGHLLNRTQLKERAPPPHRDLPLFLKGFSSVRMDKLLSAVLLNTSIRMQKENQDPGVLLPKRL